MKSYMLSALEAALSGSGADPQYLGYKVAKPHKTPNGKPSSGVAAAKRLATKRNNIRKHG